MQNLNVEDKLTELGKEVLKLRQRADAYGILLANIGENFTDSEKEELKVMKNDAEDLYRSYSLDFQNKMSVYNEKVRVLNNKIKCRADIVDKLIEQHEELQNNIDILDIFRSQHDVLVKELENSILILNK